ncbi:small integral membrane protein 14 [Cataglyphis hispanica]|uniref:small integral membrane protein 14 n=1 Tax=Cataglyphis hispanica TaxID=1086592 RepID=UPI00218010D5|nr:small integral membrane protein 14 [Cataglyphis hispanica]
MSGEGFDLCEYMQNHISLQHLLSILRQSQDYCSDIECFNVSRIPGPQNVQEPSDFLFSCLIIGFVVLIFVFRPRSMRQPSRNVIKSNNEPGSHDDPPSPPTVN